MQQGKFCNADLIIEAYFLIQRVNRNLPLKVSIIQFHNWICLYTSYWYIRPSLYFIFTTVMSRVFLSQNPQIVSRNVIKDLHLNFADAVVYITSPIISTVTSWWLWWRLKSPASPLFYSTVYSGADQRKHQSSPSLAFVWGIHRWSVNSPHKWPVKRKMFPFDDIIMITYACTMVKPRWSVHTLIPVIGPRVRAQRLSVHSVPGVRSTPITGAPHITPDCAKIHKL